MGLEGAVRLGFRKELAAAAGKVASTAVEHACGALQALLLRKLGETSEAAKAIGIGLGGLTELFGQYDLSAPFEL